MFIADKKDGTRVYIEKATKDDEYYCPICNGKVRIRKGTVKAPHFSHISVEDCDSFTSDMSEWHREWQNLFPVKNREVVITHGGEKHRADVVCYGFVIEFQHSPISETEFWNRNKFYTSAGYEVIWIFDVIGLYNNRIKFASKQNGEMQFYWKHPMQTIRSFDPFMEKNIYVFLNIADYKEQTEQGQYLMRTTWADVMGFETPWNEFTASFDICNKNKLLSWIKQKYIRKHERKLQSMVLMQNWLNRYKYKSSVSENSYVFSTINPEKKLICYYHDLFQVEECEEVLHIIDIVDFNDRRQDFKVKILNIQEKQGFCLFLEPDAKSQKERMLHAKYYIKENGMLKNLCTISGALFEYCISLEGELLFHNERLSLLINKKKEEYEAAVEKEKLRQKQWLQDYKKAQDEKAEQRKAEALQLEIEREEQKRIKKEQRIAAQLQLDQKEQEFLYNIELHLSQQITIARSPKGKRWVKCEVCGKKDTDENFVIYGGEKHANLGVCYQCHRERKNNF